jgi:eukaryotic-like serine/threonine-protein kinase
MPAQMTRSEVLNLLEPGVLLGGALFRSLATQTAQTERLSPGTRLGAFRIVAELGHGGMGVVYRAERDDGAYQQQVAIKCVIDSGSARSAELFRRERQILAELKHPNIARLLDGGHLDDGRQWLAMELVDGLRIDAHVHTKKLSVDERLGLFAEVVEAVEAAHTHLLIHRDIKPSNVLVDADGRAKLLDFGIAALIDDHEAARAYSPGWASPEQRAGEHVGPASDQYQLGLLLDAMLRNTSPSDVPATGTDIADPGTDGRGIAPTQWPRLSAARHSELAAIVAKATAVPVAARYGSVKEFNADLQRWLAQRPVVARGGGLGYTFFCALRRHPLVAAGIAAALIAAITATIVFNWRLTQQRDLARDAALRAEREAATATAVSRFLRDDLLALADPNLSQEPDLKVSTLLARAAENVDPRFAERPDIAVQIHTTLGRGLRGLGALDTAAAQFGRAQAIASAALPATDLRRMELDLWHADLDLARSQPQVAEQRLSALHQSATAVLGVDAPLVLETEVRLQAARFETGKEQLAAIAALALLQPRLDRVLGVDSALAIYALNRRAIMLNSVEQLKETEIVRVEHLARATRAYGANHSTTLTGQLNYAVLLRKLGKPDDALREAELAEKGLRKIFGDRSIAALHALNARSRILADLGQLDAAIALQREALAGRIELFGEQHDDVAFSYVNLGGSLVQARQLDAAVDALNKALRIRLHLFGEEHVDVITNRIMLGDTERQRGNLAAAELYLVDAIASARRVLASDRPELATALYRYGQVLAAQHRRDEAVAALKESEAIYATRGEQQTPRTQAVRALLATIAP